MQNRNLIQRGIKPFLCHSTDLRDANQRLDAVQRQLRDLQGSRNNKLKLFGSWVPDLLQRVEQADRRGKFHHRPVGPIGKEKLFWSFYELIVNVCILPN